MNHQQVFRLWLSIGCVAVGCLAVLSNGQAQVVSPNNSEGAVVRENLIESRPTNPGFGNAANENFLGGDSTSANQQSFSGLVDPGLDANNPLGTIGQPIGNNSVHRAKPNGVNLQKAVEALKQAKDEEARKKSLETLSKVVSQLFDADLKRRESEVGDIRNRAAKLKALINKRKESKDRIVDLQLKIQLNEVEGLGFAVKQRSGGRNQNPYYGGAGGMGTEVMMDGAGGMYSPVLGLPGGDDYGGGYSIEYADPRRNIEKTLREVMAKLKQAKSDDDRQTAEKLLRSALEDYFAADLEIREREIKEIQTRVVNLEKLIERRRQARDQVISLQLEVLKNEADGLEFFSTSSRRFSNGNGAVQMNVPGMNRSFIGFAR